VFEFFKRMFGPEPSSTTAKERLRLVLLSDHLSLAPDIVEAMKADLLAVIGRYVEFDESHAEVNFEHRDRDIAMLASVPILSVRTTPLPPPPPPRALPADDVSVLASAEPAAPRRRRRRRPKPQTAAESHPVLPQAQPAQA